MHPRRSAHRTASSLLYTLGMVLPLTMGVGRVEARSTETLRPELLDLTERAAIARVIDEELVVDAPQAIAVALAHAEHALSLSSPTRPLLVLPVTDGSGNLIAWHVIVGSANLAGGEGYAALTAIVDEGAPKGADAATRFDRTYEATRSTIAHVEVAAYRFRHPVRWAQAGLPRWLVEHDALDRLVAGRLTPRALVSWSMAAGVEEVLQVTDDVGHGHTYSPRLGRAVSGKELTTRFDRVRVFERWSANLRARYTDPAARLSFIDSLWHSPRYTPDPVFILHATQATVTSVLYPWTQASSCECCVCWETAMSTILSYWDDMLFGDNGPWDQIMAFGNRFDAPSFESLSGRLYTASGVACDGGGTSYYWDDDVISASKAVVNTQIGYQFSFDYDGLVWFGSDIEDEVRAGKPVYYGFSDSASPQPEGWQVTTGHAITIVGVEATTELLYVYGNWEPVLSQKGFDDADDARDINVTPGGFDCSVGTWVPPATSCGVGACASTGRQNCADGYFDDTCTPKPALDDKDLTCDGIDDDCDGTLDEEYAAEETSCGVGACRRTGHTKCVSGRELDLCVPGTPAANDATCDQIDDDCDGQVDEDCRVIEATQSAVPAAASPAAGGCNATGAGANLLSALLLAAWALGRSVPRRPRA